MDSKKSSAREILPSLLICGLGLYVGYLFTFGVDIAYGVHSNPFKPTAENFEKNQKKALT